MIKRRNRWHVTRNQRFGRSRRMPAEGGKSWVAAERLRRCDRAAALIVNRAETG
jgi:hypothetical protein